MSAHHPLHTANREPAASKPHSVIAFPEEKAQTAAFAVLAPWPLPEVHCAQHVRLALSQMKTRVFAFPAPLAGMQGGGCQNDQEVQPRHLRFYS